MKYVVLVLVVAFAVWQVIGLVKTIKVNKNKKSLTSSKAEDCEEDKNKTKKEV